MLTGSRDAEGAQLWEVATGKRIGPPLEQVGLAFSPDGNFVLTQTSDAREGLLRQVPRPMLDAPENVLLWTQVVTGMELDDAGVLRLLDVKTWNQRRQRLTTMPVPKLTKIN